MLISPGLALPLTLLIPILGFLAIWALDKSPNLREASTLITAGVLLLLVLIIFTAVGAGQTPGFILLNVIDGLNLELRVEPLGAMFALIASGLWIVSSLYSIGYMRGNSESNQTRFYMSFAIAISSAMGIAYAANLFTLFVFYEILTLSTFPLVTHKGIDAARHGGRIYLGILMGTSIGLLLPAIAWTYAIAGGGDFTVGGILSTKIDETGPLVPILLGLYAFGIGKAALMPAHPWLPNAMVAPTPVSAFLHAVAVVKAGVFTIMKIAIYIFGADLLRDLPATDWVLAVACFTVLASSLIALTKDNLKARLAYSTIGQLAYVTIGAMLATQAGFLGGSLQIAAHAMGKITLFMCAGAIYVATGLTNISDMRGLGRRMPWVFGAFFIASLSIIGIPPLAGGWPKFQLMLGAAEIGHSYVAWVLLLSSLLNIAYLLPIPILALMPPKGTPEPAPYKRPEGAPRFVVAAPVFTAFGTFALFFVMGYISDFLSPAMGGF